jgi:ribosome-binding factor A
MAISIKRAQKEKRLFRELSNLILQISLDEPRLVHLYISHVKMSPDMGTCTLFFTTQNNEQEFRELLQILILYKPSIRKSLSVAIPSRYTPQLRFKYDKSIEKQRRLEKILQSIKDDEPVNLEQKVNSLLS